MHYDEGESMDSRLKEVLRGAAWRTPHERRNVSEEGSADGAERLSKLLRDFSKPDTCVAAAQGMIQSILPTVGPEARQNTKKGADLRQIIVIFLTEVGMSDPAHWCDDVNVRNTARRTLAQLVCPMIAATSPSGGWMRTENKETLFALVDFYSRSSDVHLSVHHIKGMEGKHLRNVRSCLGRAYKLLRIDHLPPDTTGFRVCDETHDRLRNLSGLFVQQEWWELIQEVGAMNAIRPLYELIGARRVEGCKRLSFSWGHAERFMAGQNPTPSLSGEDIEQDIRTMMIASGGTTGSRESDGPRIALLDLMARFQRYMVMHTR
jgi:hypothetical protein